MISLASKTKSMKKRKKNSFFKEIRKNKWLYVLLLPGLIYFIVFCYMPMIGLYIAFVDYNPLAGLYGMASKFVGFSNFSFFFTSNDWIKVTWNTFYLNALFIITGLFTQILLAIGLNELGNKTFKKLTQTFMFLPNFLSWTVVSVFSIALFSTDAGVINHILNAVGLNSINFYQNASVWPVLLVFLRIWKGAGFGTVIYLASITSIDQEIYEAAKIDGSTRLQSILYITLPMLKTTTVMLLILSIGGIFNGDFGMIFALIGDNPLLRSTTDVIDTFVYRALRINNDVGMSSAVGLFQSVVGFIMVITANKIARKMSDDSSLF